MGEGNIKSILLCILNGLFIFVEQGKEKNMKNDNIKIKEGDKAKVSPKLTGLNEWVEGTVIDIEKNPFKGLVIAIKDNLGRIFQGEAKFFQINR